MEPSPSPWSHKASRAGKHGQPAQCLLRFQTQAQSEVRVWQECERQRFSAVRQHFWSGNMAELSGILVFWRLPESYGMSSCLAKTAGGVLKRSTYNWNRGVWAKARAGGSRWGRCSAHLSWLNVLYLQNTQGLLMVQCSVGCSIITKLPCCHWIKDITGIHFSKRFFTLF